MSIALPDRTPPTAWLWLGRVATARRLLALALLLGLSFVAVAALKVDCRDEPNYILSAAGHRIATADGSGHFLLASESRVCRLAAGRLTFIF